MKYKPGDVIVVFNDTSDIAIIEGTYMQKNVYYYLYRYLNEDKIYHMGTHHMNAISVFEVKYTRKQKLLKICSSQETE